MTDRAFGRWALRGVALGLMLSAASGATGGPASARPNDRAAACETLVALRVLMASAPDRDAALTRVAGHPGCRTVSRADLGAVEHRAMIGGAPFECLAVRAEPACLWVQP